MMNAIGIDVSKGKSMVAVVSDSKNLLVAPQEFSHTSAGLKQMIALIMDLGKDTKVVMEATGHYHEPVAQALYKADIFISVVNPLLVYAYGGNSVRRVKTDKKDAVKIARYCLDNWTELREHIPQETIRQQLKLFSRQYNLCIKTVHALENNLSYLLDKTFPGVPKFFTSQKKKNGHQKWVDFVLVFWHADIVANMIEDEFINTYRQWCNNNCYRFTLPKAQEIYEKSQGQTTTLRVNEETNLLITSAAMQVSSMSKTLAVLRAKVIHLSSLLPEYKLVRALYGVGEITAAQLIAEVGDVRRFHSGRALIAYAGPDPLPKQSGTYEKKSTKTSGRGSASLRKTLFLIVATHVRRSPQKEAIYQFIDRKRAEGKPYYVYMTAAANKFLRIYYARVKEYLNRNDM
jgi:transposase